jgi:hypothetical protein
MLKPLLLGTILGGLMAFLWSSASWELFGWHEKPVHSFQNEDEVARVIESHAAESGVYLLPGSPSQTSMTGEQSKTARAELMKKMQSGPIVFAAIQRNGVKSSTQFFLMQLLSLLAAAFLLSWLLLQTSGLSYWRRVIFLGAIGLAASVIVDLPNWNWWGFSRTFTAVNLADNALTWMFAGLVMAKVGYRKTA